MRVNVGKADVLDFAVLAHTLIFTTAEITMLNPQVYKFQYSRRQGLQRTYDVTLNVVQWESEVFSYESWVHFAHDFKGNGLVFPLVARTADEAAAEARGRVEDNIEHLAGVAE
jgi:hypothetical protein